MKHRETYEIMRAQDVGWGANKLVLGKLSGRAAFVSRLEELGITFDSKEEMGRAFARFKELADKKREIYDEDLQALVSEIQMGEDQENYALVAMEVISKTGRTPQAALTLRVDGRDQDTSAEGDGPVDAIFKAIEKIAHSNSHLQLYSVNAVTEGTEAQGEVTVRLEKNGRIVNGQGADTDVLAASAKAYLNALNLLTANSGRLHPQLEGV